MSVPVALIAAVAANGVIGADNSIPWRLPSDFAFFKRMTLGKPLVMGRKTFDSIGKALPGRVNIVVSRQKDFQPEGVLVMASFEAALAHAQDIAVADGAAEVMIAGGEAIYRAGMPHADRLYISHVALSPAGDAHFPVIDPDLWEVAEGPGVTPSPKDNATYHIKVYRRRSGPRR